jgi:endo-1,4-beta-D-glucanase Y
MDMRWRIVVGVCGLVAAATALAGAGENGIVGEGDRYPFGIMPSGRKAADARAVYRQWVERYVIAERTPRVKRVIDPKNNNASYSEGIGYGMLLAGYMRDRDLFDGLWGFYQSHLNENGLMYYQIDSSGRPTSRASATDGDLDVAFALLVAHGQWGAAESSYRDEAQALIRKIRQHAVEDSTHILKPGDGPGWADVVNPSYFAPAYFRVFQTVVPEAEWGRIGARSYEILKKSRHPETGLVPDWCTPDGRPAPGRSYAYSWDATRVPWRVALDHLWFGSPEASEVCAPLTRFAEKIGTKKIVSGYYLNGKPGDRWHASAFVGPFGVGSMAAGSRFQQFCDEAYLDNLATAGDNYYNLSLKVLTLFTQAGLFFNPLIPRP